MNKSEIIKLIEGLPDEIDLEDLVYELYVLLKLERAESALQQGLIVSHEEAMRRLDAWVRGEGAPTL